MAGGRSRGSSLPLIFILLLFLVAGILGKSALPSLFSVPRPDPKLPAEVIFHLFGFPVTNSIVGAWLTIIVLVGFSYLVTRRVKLIPGRLQALLEFALEVLLNFCRSVAGEERGRRFFPIMATIFLYVVFNSWLSLLPGFGSITVHTAEGEAHLLRGANTDINTPLSLALISFIFVEYSGLRSLGIRYLGKFISVGGFLRSLRLLISGKFGAALAGLLTGAIDIYVGVLETLSEFIRIVSFTFRLFGNMTAGEILLLLITFLVPWVIALPFYLLELLVGFIQALVFAGLTLVFLTVATTSHTHGEHVEESS